MYAIPLLYTPPPCLHTGKQETETYPGSSKFEPRNSIDIPKDQKKTKQIMDVENSHITKRRSHGLDLHSLVWDESKFNIYPEVNCKLRNPVN